MYKFRGCLLLVWILGGASSAALAQSRPWAELGRAATTAEIRAWDIDVRTDFVGLPKGVGSAQQGMQIWDEKCAACHGTFGESNEVFTPIAGGTSREDVRTGRVANLRTPEYPQRSTLMKLSQLSTLWDYINRAMPWTAPKSLTVDEVYAVTAYILFLGDVVPLDYVLTDRTMVKTQALLPNRAGMAPFAGGMWSVKGRPDVRGDLCQRNCAVAVEPSSTLPAYARDSHGNLADQQRIVGPMRGQTTMAPKGAGGTP
jgi:S-disulfanyl-L-cysteine oxidoreductase SoxD